jgi:hypothetical protein
VSTKRSIATAAAVLVLAAAFGRAGTPAANPAWDKLKTLVGKWKGTYTGAEGTSEGRLSYALVSNGTSLMETMNSSHDEDMVTMYHVDGNRILATHYCAMGNQPRMAAPGLSADGKTLAFAFVDASNVSDPDGGIMRSLVIRFQDADHFSQDWTWREKGKDQVATFTYARVK